MEHCDGRNKNRRESTIAKYLHRYLIFFHRQKSWTQKNGVGSNSSISARDPVTLKKRGWKEGKESSARQWQTRTYDPPTFCASQ